MSDKGERPGADFVEIVLGGMPVTILRKVSDHIHRGDPALQERIMIVFGGKGFIQKKRRVAEPVSGIPKQIDRKSTRLNSSHGYISYAVFCLKKKNTNIIKLALQLNHPPLFAHQTRPYSLLQLWNDFTPGLTRKVLRTRGSQPVELTSPHRSP